MKYSELVTVYDKLESTTKRLDKTNHIAEFLKKVSEQDIEIVTLLLQGIIFPKYDERKVGVASRLVLKALNTATGIEVSKIEKEWKNIGDLGEVAEKLVGKKKQATLFSQDLTVKKVFDNLRALAGLEGPGTVDRKVKLVAELLTSAKPREAKYIIRTVLEEMRVGVGEGSLRDALVWAYFSKEIGMRYNEEEKKIEFKYEDGRKKYNDYTDILQSALDVTNDFSKVAKVAKEKGIKGLGKLEVKTEKPVKVMLFQKAKDFEDAFERVGKPAAFEFKYDGFRLEIHKSDSNIKLFTRRLEDVSRQFPDVIEFVKKSVKGKDFIIDSEVTGIDPKTKKYLAFQSISQRIKRKYNIEEMTKTIPVMVHIFDVISVDGKNVINEPYKERLKILKKIVGKMPHKIDLAEQIITGDMKEAKKFYEKALSMGNEGVMAKNLEAPYKPGSRVGYGVKIKPTMETLDLVIIGAEWGTGKRGKWLSSFDIACIKDGEFLEIGKFGTGVKEKAEEGTSFEEMTELLKPLIKSEKGKHVFVKPKIVVELDYEEIQKSPTYSSGFALRFPRLVKLRPDKPVDEIATLNMVKQLYSEQRGRK
ncbi:ATP-dependent DNA ligase [Candidatus Woesearchaeota archaeon]|nr:ATP-dependent DNA ligase [Candidatus Woesearchaeota archaeon]